MSFIDKNLLVGERVVFRTTKSRKIAIVGTVMLAIFGLAFAKVIVVSIISWLMALGVWLGYKTTEYVVTNRRVIIKTGVVVIKSQELLLTKIETIRYNQGLADRLAGVGSVTIIGSGGTPEPIKYIESALEFRNHIQREIECLHEELYGH